jgi:hypothetical protein
MNAELIQRRLDGLTRKHEEARTFAGELAALESSEWDPARKADIAIRRRDVELQAARFEVLLQELRAELCP